MSGKDVLKMLLCSYGYDRNIDIQTYHGEGGCIGYEVNAANYKDDQYIEANCEGLMFHIYCILSYMKENNVNYKHDWWDVPIKEVVDDNLRNKLLKRFDERDIKQKEQIEKAQPIFDWLAENNPCKNCTINKHDHWDDIHYNCELNHNHSCDRLKENDIAFEKFKKKQYDEMP